MYISWFEWLASAWASGVVNSAARSMLAYLDPGSGSYLLQLLIAGIMGALLMLRVYWSKVKGFVSGLFGRSASEDEE